MSAHRFAAWIIPLLALVWSLPGAAKKAPVDPAALVCEIDWTGSFGIYSLKQTYSGAGALTAEELRIRLAFPAGGTSWGSGGGSLTLVSSDSRGAGYGNTTQFYFLGLPGPWTNRKGARIAIAFAEGEPLVLPMESGAGTILVTEAQLTRLLAAPGRLQYRMYVAGRDGQERVGLSVGWLDLSSFAEQPGAGLPQRADQLRAMLVQAKHGDDPPCARLAAAHDNSAASGEPVRRWLKFDCQEKWSGPLGEFELSAANFSWRPRPRDGIAIRFQGHSPSSGLSGALLTGADPARYGGIAVQFDRNLWSGNYRSGDPKLNTPQTAELRRGNMVVRETLGQQGQASFLWSAYAQLLPGEGDLTFSAQDARTSASARTVLPWAEVIAADRELGEGRDRMAKRERDPLNQCTALIDEELGGEEIIVT